MENSHLGWLLGKSVEVAGASVNVINALNNKQDTPTATVTGVGVTIPTPSQAQTQADYTKFAIIGGVAVVGLVAAILIFKR